MNVLQVIIMVSIFIILLVVVFKPVKSAFNLNPLPSCIVSVCVSALCVIGIRHFLGGSIEAVLLPYTAMAIAILAMLFFVFIGRYFRRPKDRLPDYTIHKDEVASADRKQLKRL
jgi:hypothetical protein